MTARFASRPNPRFTLPAVPGAPTASAAQDEVQARRLFPKDMPQLRDGIYQPQGYEPNYAYPLIVWVQGPGANPHELPHVLPLISDRNYVGTALQVRTSLERSELLEQGLPPRELQRAQRQLTKQVRTVARACHLHPERVYLAGTDLGGTFALQLALAFADRVAGVAMLGAPLPNLPQLCRRGGFLGGPQVFLGAGRHDRHVNPEALQQAGVTCTAAGLSTTVQQYASGHQVTREMLSDLNRWMMQAITAPQS